MTLEESELALDEASPDSVRRPSGLRGWLAAWRSLGPATQAAVPGGYAWAVTVAPVGFGSGAGILPAVSATLGLASLLVGGGVVWQRPAVGRVLVGWGLVASAALTWAVAPESRVLAFDATRGIAGMLGWALFAFAIASPARQGDVSTLLVAKRATRHRTLGRNVDRAVLLAAIVSTAALEVPGWRVEQRDRALLLRLVALAGGLGLVTAAGAILVRHHTHHTLADDKRRRRRRLRRSEVAWVATACLLVGAGVTFQLWR